MQAEAPTIDLPLDPSRPDPVQRRPRSGRHRSYQGPARARLQQAGVLSAIHAGQPPLRSGLRCGLYAAGIDRWPLWGNIKSSLGDLSRFRVSLWNLRLESYVPQGLYHISFVARAAPSTMACSLAQAILLSTFLPQAEVPKPQSLLAMTFSRPTSSA